jgi:hypothetical protein
MRHGTPTKIRRADEGYAKHRSTDH